MVATVDQMTQCTPMLHCLACDSTDLRTHLDLGWQPLANDYHDGTTELAEFPLAVNVCGECYHSQLTYAVNPDLLFKEYSYVSGTTATLSAYFDEFVAKVEAQSSGRRLSVLDIAGNDGTLLNKFAWHGHDVLNVDPAANLTELSLANDVPTLCEYWGVDTYLALPDVYDVIVAMNVLGHVDNPLAFLIGCRNALADRGQIYVQTSQCEWIQRGEFDTCYHEHHSYFTAKSFLRLAERAGLNVRSVAKPAIHGTSYLWTLAFDGEPDASVAELLAYETAHDYYDVDAYNEFANDAVSTSQWLLQVVDLYGDAGFATVGYGAAAKGNTLLNFGGVGLDCIVDNNPLKVGKLTPGMNIPIVDIEHLRTIDAPLCCVVLAWNFFPEIVGRVKAVRSRADDVFVRLFPTKEISL